MISGVAEGYVEVVDSKTFEFDSDMATLLFKELCEGVDLAREQGYRYGYDIVKSGKKFKVNMIDIGI